MSLNVSLRLFLSHLPVSFCISPSPVSPLYICLLSPSLLMECYPAHVFFSIEVSLAVVDLNTWSSLFSRYVPSSHSSSIIPPPHHSLWFVPIASVCLHIYFPLRFTDSPLLQKRFPLYIPPSLPFFFSSSPQGDCLLHSFINSFPSIPPCVIPPPTLHCSLSLPLNRSAIALVFWKR